MLRRTVLKSSILFTLGALSSLGLNSCEQSKSLPNSKSHPPLKVAMVPWLGWGSVKISEERGFFEDEGLAVEQIVFQTVSEVNTALVSGQVDMAWVAATDLEILAQQMPLKFIMASDYSGDVDAIIGTGINSSEDAKTKIFAREEAPYQIVFMTKYLESLGLKESDVTILPLSVPDSAAALIAGNVDAAASYDPFLSQALEASPNTEVLFSAKGTNIIINGLAGQHDVLSQRRHDVLAYLRALSKATTFARTNPEEANAIISNWVGISTAEVEVLMKKVDLLDLEKNKTIAFAEDNERSVVNSINSAARILMEAGKIDKILGGSTLVDASFVAEL